MVEPLNSWNRQLITQLFIPIEAQQILQIPITDRSQQDNLTWDGTLDGNYSVKYGYHAIMEWGNTNDVNNAHTSSSCEEIWKFLWKLNVPPKHVHLMWRTLNNAIPVKGNIFKRGVRCDPLCPRCLCNVETTHHAFLECDWAKQRRNYLQLKSALWR
ncbi:hypothetical protein TSUD_129340 [Trifolium subterraneum]|uniref:Reverse transcriptase zinc-binding domain-containing protein n=1 Tax=Trifolium subterraneum TaxID=3900 RepID=A0A2Z6P5M0_TRISU|nr:hypothetical protein TSUD_129340 [Trifolium subterraneum]